MNSTLLRCSRRWRKYLEHKMESESFGSQPRQHTALQLCKLEGLAFTDGDERPLIHECEHAAHGNAWYIRLLLETGRFEPNARDDDGFTPLMAAAEFGHIEVLKLLVEHNADVRARSSGAGTSRQGSAGHSCGHRRFQRASGLPACAVRRRTRHASWRRRGRAPCTSHERATADF